MRDLLQCGHIVSVPENEWPEWCDCPHCGMSVMSQAFECREYHIKCMECRYGRWFGQDKNTALRAHNNGHRVQLAYMVRPDKRDAVKTLYGRKVRLIIPDVPTQVKHPEMRSWMPLLPETGDQEMNEDVPPY